jgi:hypothetical protein
VLVSNSLLTSAAVGDNFRHHMIGRIKGAAQTKAGRTPGKAHRRCR